MNPDSEAEGHKPQGPLSGLSVIEIAGIGPAPFCAMLLADMGADVIRIDKASAVRSTGSGAGDSVVGGAAAMDSAAGVSTFETSAPLQDEFPRQPSADLLARGRRSLAVDLKTPEGVETVLRLVATADVLLEGFRPGVAERLGIGPKECMKRNPALIYGRMTGWGQDGPYAQTAGHDINYIALSGLLGTIGPKDCPPTPPVNYLGDFGGGGMLLAFGIMCAIFAARQGHEKQGKSDAVPDPVPSPQAPSSAPSFQVSSLQASNLQASNLQASSLQASSSAAPNSGIPENPAQGQVIDAAMVDGSALLATFVYGMHASGFWQGRGENLLDGGAYHYNTYECADGNYISIGSLEPQFYKELVELLSSPEIKVNTPESDAPVSDSPEPDSPVSDSQILQTADPWDRQAWPGMRQQLAKIFASRTRQEWCELLEGTDVCFAPVLGLDEAPAHPHNSHRQTFVKVAGVTQPAPAPRFSRTPASIRRPPPHAGQDSDEILLEAGFGVEEIASLRHTGAVR